MNIREMHVMFREMAQQMGMQTTRAILSEDIDIILNSVIIDKVREVLIQGVQSGVYPDKVIRQNATIAPINAIRTLYCKANILESSITTEAEKDLANEINPWQITCNSNSFSINNHKVMLYTGFKVSYNLKDLYDCRIIENEDLGQTLRDFCNRATPDAPIVTVLGDTNSITVDIYTGTTKDSWTNISKFLKPRVVQVLYIREPAKVNLDIVNDNRDNNSDVDCDLPPYLHSELVERAVSKYLVAIGATSGKPSNNN